MNLLLEEVSGCFTMEHVLIAEYYPAVGETDRGTWRVS